MGDLKIGSSAGGLGDNLIFTPIFKHLKGVTMQMVEHPKSRRIAPIFKGLAKVEFVKNPVGCPEGGSSGHVAQKKLDGLNIQTENCIPEVLISAKEIHFGLSFIREKIESIFIDRKKACLKCKKSQKPIIAFVGDNNGSGNPSDHFAHHRLLSNEQTQKLINKYAENYIVLQFGVSKNSRIFDNVIRCCDLEIRQLIGVYYVIGRYFGIDTGDYHLMLACGGEADVYVPETTHFYNHREWHYRPELWKGEKVRVNYVPFKEFV